MRNATYELAIPASPTSLSSARDIASATIAVDDFVTCSSMAIACSGQATRCNRNPKPQPRPKANPELAQSLLPTPTWPLTLALRLSTHPGPSLIMTQTIGQV